MNEPSSTMPRVSFIVPVFNDAVRLQHCLKSIGASGCRQGGVEVVVVDNGSIDGSAHLARGAGATVIARPDATVAELRNCAAREARGQILAFVDADNEIAPEWTASAIETLQLPEVGAVGAPYHAPSDGTWVQRAYGHLRGRARGRHEVEWLGSGNLAVWRSAFEAIGGFDTSLDTCEDVELCRRLRTAGFRVVSDERLRNVHHGDPATLRALFKGELWRGRDNLRVSFRRPLGWRMLASAVIPMVHLGLISVAVAAPIWAGLDGLWLSALAILVACVPTWMRVARALRGHGGAGLSVVRTFAVACVYDLGRALALIVRMPHRNRRSVATS